MLIGSWYLSIKSLPSIGQSQSSDKCVHKFHVEVFPTGKVLREKRTVGCACYVVSHILQTVLCWLIIWRSYPIDWFVRTLWYRNNTLHCDTEFKHWFCVEHSEILYKMNAVASSIYGANTKNIKISWQQTRSLSDVLWRMFANRGVTSNQSPQVLLQ